MQCPRCGSVAHPGQKFCEQCGTPLPENAGAGAMSVAPSTENAALALVGRTVAGKYKVVKLLGEGGMGCVYVAEQSMGTTTRKVALKTLHLELSSDPKIRARFEREVATVAHLEHPNTIKVFDFGTAEAGMLYIVMELAVGRTLADLLEKEGALDPDRAAKILTQVCGSLEEAHAHGIIHRDLKPDNIMLVERLGQKDVVKVLDFGIAKNRDEENRGAKLTQQGTVLGTPPYMSPEQFTGAALDVRSDIYSLGVVAYEMLTGRLPFEAASAFEWATLHMTSQPRPIEEQPMGSCARFPRSASRASPSSRRPSPRRWRSAPPRPPPTSQPPIPHRCSRPGPAAPSWASRWTRRCSLLRPRRPRCMRRRSTIRRSPIALAPRLTSPRSPRCRRIMRRRKRSAPRGRRSWRCSRWSRCSWWAA